MSSYEERVAAAAAVREVIASVAGAQLRALPGVYHVAAGLRHRRGQLTRELCMRVYVRDKLPNEWLSPAQRVPREINGVPTDVNVQNRPFHTQDDRTTYRPVKGGTMISNGIVVLQPNGQPGIEEGTFGITATRNSDQDIMLLSCYHVLMAGGAKKGSPIFQPTHEPDFFLRPEDLPARPKDDENKIAEISRAVLNSKVDAAIARIDVSSCCRSCGIDWRDEIVELSEAGVPPSNKLLGLRRAEIGDSVFKRGATTGRTQGTVFCTDLPDFALTIEGQHITFTGQMGIEGLGLLEPFSLRGDSGSVVVTDTGFVVGLLFAGDGFGLLADEAAAKIRAACPEWQGQNVSVANHISDVTSALGISINLDRSTHDSAGPRGTPPFIAMNDAERERLAVARERVRADPAGAWIWALCERHRVEAVDLVRHHRPVTVAWHRAGGPALLAAALNTLRAGGDTLPVPADGSTLESALIRIGDALRTHGSPALGEAIATHRELLLAAVRDSATVTQFLAKLRPFVAASAFVAARAP